MPPTLYAPPPPNKGSSPWSQALHHGASPHHGLQAGKETPSSACHFFLESKCQGASWTPKASQTPPLGRDVVIMKRYFRDAVTLSPISLRSISCAKWEWAVWTKCLGQVPSQHQ